MHSPEGRHRFEFQLLAGENSIEMKSNNSVYKFLSPWLDSSQYTIERSEVYKFRGTKANQWKIDNIFLLGDAAHQIPPYAGQGINSGIRDSINICWKLNMIVNHSLNPIMLESYQIEREIHVEETIKSSIALGKLIDSLSIAYKKNMPIVDAVAPEARDQAYGGRKANPSENINPGIYFNSLSHKFTGRLIPNCRLKDNKNVDVYLDSEINGQIAIIGEGNIYDYLDHDTVSLFKKLNTKFINILDYSFKNTDLREMIKAGFILVRPDFHIYGITDSENNLKDLAEQFFASLCLYK
jgi:3-(3-hydroxy-phenyl)propionate hydroxylase